MYKDIWGKDSLERDGIRVELKLFNNGWEGNFNPEDPKDIQFYSIYCSEIDQGFRRAVKYGRVITQLDINTPEFYKNAALLYVMNELFEDIINKVDIRDRMESLSWISLDMLMNRSTREQNRI